MRGFSLKEFSQMVGLAPKTVNNLVTLGTITKVKKTGRCLEFEADAALDYLAKKYPKLVASKDDCAMRSTRRIVKPIVKVSSEEVNVKNGGWKG